MLEIDKLQRKYREKFMVPIIKYKQVDRGLTSDEIQGLFDLQALVDDSEDTPILFNSAEDKLPVVEIEDGRLTLEAAYTISSDVSDPDHPDKRSMIVIKGSVENGRDGNLSEEDLVDAVGDGAVVKRLNDAFGVEEGEGLTVATFLREMITASLGNKVSINKMWLGGDELGITVLRTSVDEIG